MSKIKLRSIIITIISILTIFGLNFSKAEATYVPLASPGYFCIGRHLAYNSSVAGLYSHHTSNNQVDTHLNGVNVNDAATNANRRLAYALYNSGNDSWGNRTKGTQYWIWNEIISGNGKYWPGVPKNIIRGEYHSSTSTQTGREVNNFVATDVGAKIDVTGSLSTENYKMGPFKASYNGRITEITVKDIDGKEIDSKDLKIIQNDKEIKLNSYDSTLQKNYYDIAQDQDFYIINASENEVNTIYFHVYMDHIYYTTVYDSWWEGIIQPILHVTERKEPQHELLEADCTLDIEAKKGNIELKKLGTYSYVDENGKKVTVENPLSDITFKVYCNTFNKYVKDIVSNSNSSKGTKMELTDKIEEAKDYTTGKDGTIKISDLLAGCNYSSPDGNTYTYTLVEFKGDQDYYNDPLKIAEVNSNQNYFKQKMGEFTDENGNKYNAITDVKILDKWTSGGKQIDYYIITIKDERTSGDLTIKKQAQKGGKLLAGVEFKLKLIEAKEFSNIKNMWVTTTNTKGSKNTFDYSKVTNGKYNYVEFKHDSYLTEDKENGAEAGTFVTNSKGQIDITGLLNGTYQIYETKSAKGYDIEGQEGYGKDTKHPEWVDCGTVVIDGMNTNKVIKTVNNIETRGNLDIEKEDSKHNELKLQGAEFKLLLVEATNIKDIKNKWITTTNVQGSEDTFDYSKVTNGNYDYLNYDYNSFLTNESNLESAGTFVTNADGKISIPGILNGKYHVYETKTPKGYDITKQEGYQKENNWVDCGEVIVNNEYDEKGLAKYPTYKIDNDKIVDKIEGHVWLDRPETIKAGDEIFDSLRFTPSDGLIDPGITVNLKNENGEIINSAVTDGEGYWHIDAKGNGEKFNYWDLVNAYVEFVYNNQKYVCVDTFAEGNDKVIANSKAKEYTLSKEELNDTKLTGTTGSLPGLAVTKQNAVNKEMTAKEINERRWDNPEYKLEDLGLTGYYNEENHTIENINLGLWEKENPSHSITHSLQYSKIQMNGYTYTYDYTGEKGAITDSNRVPETLKQVGAKAYAGAIVYPSDIAYTAERKPNGMEMYVVYKIDVVNPTTTKKSNIYDETRLYLTSLTDTFDTRRYELNTQHSGDQSWKGSEYFDLWETTNEGTANYKISEDAKLASANGADAIDGSLSNGVNAGEEKAESVYIQFKVQQSFLEDLLSGSITDELMSSAVTEAHSVGHHSYTRTDNVWNEKESASYYEGSTNADQNIANQNVNGHKQFLHRSIDENKDSGAFCLIFRLGDQRTISGTVFEDFVAEESNEQNEGLGNGIIDQNEANRAQNVKVELIDAAKVANNEEDTRADLYVRTSESGRGYRVVSGNDTVVTTGEDGRYEFVGVVPGLYAIRFTYSDGNTIMVDSQGNKIDDITSNNYRSTIINTDKAKDYIKNANETSVENMIGYVNAYNNTSNKDAQKYAEWYKYLYAETPDVNYNMATDNFEIRNNLGTYNYKENGEGTEVTNQDNSKLDKWPEVPSNTPYFSISIENNMENVGNTEDGHNPIFDKFNFGLIKATEITMKTDKIISNVKLVNQIGTALEQGDPSKTRNYITALDNLTKGSKYVRTEMSKDEIYGSTIETTYEITISNDSVKDYIEEENTPEYGYYFKYGQKTDNAYLKTTTVIEAIDLIDEDYQLSNGDLTETVVHPAEAKDGARTDTDGKVKMSIIQNENQPNYLSFTNWSAIEAGGSSQIDYTVNGILQEDMDLSYDNSAKVVSMKLDAGSTLKTAYDWGEYSTTRLMVTPDTGENRNQTYYIIAAIALVILSTGIIVIKKKILK